MLRVFPEIDGPEKGFLTNGRYSGLNRRRHPAANDAAGERLPPGAYRFRNGGLTILGSAPEPGVIRHGRSPSPGGFARAAQGALQQLPRHPRTNYQRTSPLHAVTRITPPNRMRYQANAAKECLLT